MVLKHSQQSMLVSGVVYTKQVSSQEVTSESSVQHVREHACTQNTIINAWGNVTTSASHFQEMHRKDRSATWSMSSPQRYCVREASAHAQIKSSEETDVGRAAVRQV